MKLPGNVGVRNYWLMVTTELYVCMHALYHHVNIVIIKWQVKICHV